MKSEAVGNLVSRSTEELLHRSQPANSLAARIARPTGRVSVGVLGRGVSSLRTPLKTVPDFRGPIMVAFEGVKYSWPELARFARRSVLLESQASTSRYNTILVISDPGIYHKISRYVQTV